MHKTHHVRMHSSSIKEIYAMRYLEGRWKNYLVKDKKPSKKKLSEYIQVIFRIVNLVQIPLLKSGVDVCHHPLLTYGSTDAATIGDLTSKLNN
jgi:hypothetical protein